MFACRIIDVADEDFRAFFCEVPRDALSEAASRACKQ
jgi:hypothetical protein